MGKLILTTRSKHISDFLTDEDKKERIEKREAVPAGTPGHTVTLYNLVKYHHINKGNSTSFNKYKDMGTNN